VHVARLYGRVEIQPHNFITSALVGELSASRPGHFNLEESILGTAGIVGRVGPGNSLVCFAEETDLCRKWSQDFSEFGMRLLVSGKRSETDPMQGMG